MDEAIRALCRAAATVTVEYLEDRYTDATDVMARRPEIAREVEALMMDCADECSDCEVHAVRRLAWPPASVSEALNSGDGSYNGCC